MTETSYVSIRCPRCKRLVAEAAPRSAVRVKCGRCKAMVQWPPTAVDLPVVGREI